MTYPLRLMRRWRTSSGIRSDGQYVRHGSWASSYDGLCQTADRRNQLLFRVKCPDVCRSEVDYVVTTVFTDWFGIEFEFCPTDQHSLTIECQQKVLSFSLDFFVRAGTDWLGAETLPKVPLKRISLDDIPQPRAGVHDAHGGSVPILFGEPWVNTTANRIHCGLDLFGSVFFLLSRYEEIVVRSQDPHGRFPSSSSILVQAGILDRPIATEYAELLWRLMVCLWPHTERRQRTFKTKPTHDVDRPFLDLSLSMVEALRRATRQVVTTRGFAVPARSLVRWASVRLGAHDNDPNNTFDFIMDASERLGLASSFYFAATESPGPFDPKYSVHDPAIKRLMLRMLSRGHEIGIHPTYDTLMDLTLLRLEADRLRSILKATRQSPDSIGGRQHYLRWRAPETWRDWEAAGLRYDSSVMFPDRIGFRTGSCHEFPVYDAQRRQPLHLRERPLIAMEVSVLSPVYMGIADHDQAFATLSALKDTCRRYAGDFTLLWHNNHLVSSPDRELYLAVLEA